MKRIMFLMSFLIGIFASGYCISNSQIYTVNPSTYSVITSTITGSITPKIAGKVRVKQISIIPTATAQTVSIYSNATSTRTITSVASWKIPANSYSIAYDTTTTITTQTTSATNCPIYPISPVILDDVNNFDCNDFEVLTSTTTNPATITILYR